MLRTHEPWRNDEIKRKLREDSELYSDGLEIANLFIDDRENHTRELIIPNLDKRVIILNSRYKMSTCAYQWAQGVSLDELLNMHKGKTILTPDITFLLDVPISIARKRVRKRGDALEKFERNSKFIKDLIKKYDVLFNLSIKNPEIFGRVVMMDSNMALEEVADDVYRGFLEAYDSG